MKEKMLWCGRANLAVAMAGLTVGWLCCVGHAQTPPANLSPGLQEVVKLSQAHMADDVIVAYIKNSGTSYSLSANDILYLNSQGVSQPVISTLLQSKSASSSTQPVAYPPPPGPPPAEQQNYGPGTAPVPAAAPVTVSVAPPPPSAPPSTPPPAPGAGVSFDYFHDQLSPYGTWIDMPGYGWCFHPTDASLPGWRPYCDAGHWVYTDDGWYWQSDYPWGEIAFHYGRWHYSLSNGWLWVPGYDYAPAWVCWRHAEGYCGWAPLPPTAVFRVGVGLTFNGRVALDVDFGLNQTYFTFVAYDHFWDRDCRRYVVPRERVEVFYRSSVVINNYHMDHGRFVVEGLGHERIAAMTHHEVRAERVAIRDERIAHHIEEHSRVIDHGARPDYHGYDRNSREENFHNAYPASKGGSQDWGRGKTYSNGKQSSSGGKSDSQGKNGDPKR